MDCHFLLQGIFSTQKLNLGLLHFRWTLYHLSHQGSPKGSAGFRHIWSSDPVMSPVTLRLSVSLTSLGGKRVHLCPSIVIRKSSQIHTDWTGLSYKPIVCSRGCNVLAQECRPLPRNHSHPQVNRGSFGEEEGRKSVLGPSDVCCHHAVVWPSCRTWSQNCGSPL